MRLVPNNSRSSRSIRLGVVPGVALALAAAGAAHADDGATVEALRAEQRTERRTYALWRTRVSHPLRASAGIGLISARIPIGYDCRSPCRISGFVAQLEPGLAGVQLSGGWGSVVGERARDRALLRRAYVGYGVRAAVLRTSHDASLDPARRTLVGVEGQFSIINVNVTLGAFHDAFGTRSDDGWLLAGGLGFGF